MSGGVDTPVVIDFPKVVELYQSLARQIVDSGIKPDGYLILGYGGLFPGGLMVKILEPIFGKLPASSLTMSNYDKNNVRLESPIVLEAPPAEIYSGKRIIIFDDVWHTGGSIVEAVRRVAYGNGSPIVATLYFKPGQNLYYGWQPNFYVEPIDHWVQFPWEDPLMLLSDDPCLSLSTP